VAVLAADIYRPGEWHDFFVMVGGAAAVLTGLVFVALSLNLGVILRDAMHRARSIGTLTSFASIFVICALALMGDQNHVTIGIEWLLVSIGAALVFVYPWPTARRASPSTLTFVRFMTGNALYLGELVGSVMLISGAIAGLYVAAVSMTLLAVYAGSGAWLLLVGAHNDAGEASRH
jgi:modulator of FtsH protease